MKSFIAFLPLSATVAFTPVTIPKSFSSVGKWIQPKATASSSQDFRVVTTIPETKKPAPHTFAGQVERVLLDKYGESEIQRVLESWRLLDLEYEHCAFFGKEGEVDPQTSNCYQYAHSYVPGLSVTPFWDTKNLLWAEKLAKSYKTIRKEFDSVTSDMAHLTKTGNNIWAGALTEEAGGYGQGWSTLVLKDRGIWDETNCSLFPKTAQAVYKAGVPATEVFFASMKPNSSIKLHSDFTNFVLTSHLALVIPENGKNKCRLTIGDETRQWIEGEVSVFDTSLMHDAINESNETRYILMMRVWHPDLTEKERNALQTIYDCLEVPELTSSDEATRVAAQQKIDSMRTFPQLQSSSSGGFGGSKANARDRKSVV